MDRVLIRNRIKKHRKKLYILKTTALYRIISMSDSQNYVHFKAVQYVAQYPDGTSIRTLKTKTQFLRRPFQLSVNEVFRMKAQHFSFKMKVLAS